MPRLRPYLQLSLSEDALGELAARGGGRDRSAVVEALLAALQAGEVPTFTTRLEEVLQRRRDAAADRARGLRKK